MTWHVTLDYETYGDARRLFEWEVPNEYNIAWDLVGKHRDARGAVALFQAYPDGRRETYTFRDVDVRSSRLAHGLDDLGVGRGDRVAIVVPQKPAYPLTHLACWKLGAVSVPISTLYGTDALRYRLQDSGATAAVVDESVRDGIDAVRGDCPDLEAVVQVDGEAGGDARGFDALCEGQPRELTLADTDADTPATILYTSGTTGDPKGVLHTHDVWIGHYPGFYARYDRSVRGDSAFYTPTDWAWMGTLATVVCPAWHYGRPIVGYAGGSFDPETAFGILEEFGVTHAFFAPTALRMLRTVEASADRYDLDLELIASGGEPVTADIHDWADTELEGVTVNEGYGRTEGTTLIANCQDWFEPRVGSMGKPVPGHDVAVVDPETGDELPPGEVGEIAVERGEDPALFAEYWNKPEETAESRLGEWDLTGDLAEVDGEGYFWYKSRADDVIITSGYRVGPREVEEAVLGNPDVADVGVVGVPHDTRGEIIKAFVRPQPADFEPDALREGIRERVRERLAKHQYPREIEFVDDLPTTETGKLRRTELRGREGTGG